MRLSPPRGLAALALLLPLAAHGEVFVNEIHYDNDGADSNEFVEVVATAGEDLSQYALYFYNGNTGGLSTSTSPNPQSLAAGQSVTCGTAVRIAVLSPNQIENGGPDGIALVGPGASLIQFLSYEGSFAANAGPASGSTSIDIGVSEPGTTPVGQSLQLSGSGASYPDFTWQAPATATPGTCNTGQSFGAAVDVAPTLAGSNPVDGGELVINASLSLTFSEPVALGNDWFALECSASGVLGVADATISGGPTSWSIDPAEDLVDGESCTLTLVAAAITDLDGDADALAGDNQIAFTAAAPPPNVAPSVLSTTPAQGSDSFPSAADIVVTFSETVDIANGAFSLACAQSTGIVLSHAAQGSTIQVDTGTALVHGDSCTFGIDEALVTDADGAALQAFTDLGFSVAADSSGTYYEQVNTSSAEQLRCSLHATIDDHTAYPYTASTTDTWDILNLADEDPVDSSKIWDVYRNASYTKISGGQGEYNREHTWPNTYGFSAGDPGPYTDTHMLYLTHVQYNSDRGSKPFANCDSGCGERATIANHGVGGGGGGDSNWVQSGASESMGSFEVWDYRKGDMARAVMYMAIRYEGAGLEPDLELTDNRALITSAGSNGKHYMGLLTHLIGWHQADPPDARELARNEIVYSFQGNRNPFIDHPEWGTLALFTSAQPASCTLGLSMAIFADGFEPQ